MKTNILMIALLLIATVSFSQTKQDSKTDEKPLRKIAGGNGSKQIEEEVEREVEKAMKDLRVELKDLDIKINLDVLKQLEGLDEEIAESLEGLDIQINESIAESLEGLDEEINESVEESLRALDHLDIDIDIDRDFDFDFDNDHDRSIEQFRKEALKDDLQKPAPKKDPKKKD